MEIFLTLSPYPSLLEDMVIKAYEAQAPSAEVASITIPERDNTGTPTPGAGHQVDYEVHFTGLDRVPHVVRLFTDGGTLLQDFDVIPEEDTVKLFKPIFFKIGDGGTLTPAVGTDEYANLDLAGLTNEDMVISINIETLHPGIDYNVDNTGGFQLLGGRKFEIDDKVTIQPRPQAVVTPVNDSVVGKVFGGFIDVNGTTRSYSAGDLRKQITIRGNATYNFTNSVSVPIGYEHVFVNDGSGTGTIGFQNAALKTAAGNVTSFVLQSGFQASFTFNGTNWKLNYHTGQSPNQYKIVAKGTATVGNVVGNKEIVVNIGSTLASAGYQINGALRGVNPANKVADCTVIWSVVSQTTTQFTVIFREEVGVNQNLLFDWSLVL